MLELLGALKIFVVSAEGQYWRAGRRHKHVPDETKFCKETRIEMVWEESIMMQSAVSAVLPSFLIKM